MPHPNLLVLLVLLISSFFLLRSPPAALDDEPEPAPRTASNASRARCPSDLVLLAATIARSAAHELPFLLANLERLASMVGALHVLLVENGSRDGGRALRAWADERGVPFLESEDDHKDWTPPYPPAPPAPPLRPSRHPKILSARAVAFRHPGGKKDLRTLARARDGYLHALRTHSWYSNVDYLFPVDTDMCVPWRVERQRGVEGWEGVWTNLLAAERRYDRLDPSTSHLRPPFGGKGWSALFPNGICGWYLPRSLPNGTVASVPAAPHAEGAQGYYCDRFALDGGGAFPGGALDHRSCAGAKKGGWYCEYVGPEGMKNVKEQGDGEGKEPFVPVRGAFGGAALYSAPLLRARSDCVYSGSKGCEHAGLNDCLRTGEGWKAEMGIAARWTVDWEGCGEAPKEDGGGEGVQEGVLDEPLGDLDGEAEVEMIGGRAEAVDRR
ncbi:hypothetical protein DFJ74DRAFT_647754 [Hyaloraphidium curvatum]|nr:hypothetical protein DFJ74DRAFT_647754 [Hyaloraphidium curvatum]